MCNRFFIISHYLSFEAFIKMQQSQCQ
jgi:hypothetical protein